MQIQNNYSPNFRGLEVSKDAKKLMKYADRVVRKVNPEFKEVVVEEGGRLPILSTLIEKIAKRQIDNPNHIKIDLLDRNKKLLQIKLLDNKGYTNRTWEMSPMPKLGSFREIYPDAPFHYSTDYNNGKIYGKHEFYNLLDTVEFHADRLKEHNLVIPKISHKALPKVEKIKPHHQRNILHVQRPFLKLRKMLENLNKPEKLNPSEKPHIPRKMKKELQKSNA